MNGPITILPRLKSPALCCFMIAGLLACERGFMQPRRENFRQGVDSEKNPLCADFVQTVPNSGCLPAPLDNPHGRLERKVGLQDSTTSLFFRWAKPSMPDPEKKTVLVIHGGPGGTHDAYVDNPVMNDLNLHYNVLFYDQRGSGRSVSAQSISGKVDDLQFFHSSDHIGDIESIRVNLIKQDKMIVLGHSYGAHLAIAYATLFPDHVDTLIAVNGSSQNKAFGLQLLEHQKLLAQVHKKFDRPTLMAFYELLAVGKIVDQDDDVIGEAEFKSLLSDLFATYLGQTILAQQVLNRLIEINSKSINTQRNRNGPLLSLDNPDLGTASFQAGDLEAVNARINDHILCHDFLGGPGYFDFENTQITLLAGQYFNRHCVGPGIFSDNQVEIFDYASGLLNIQSRVLLVGSSHDPKVPLSLQRRDFEHLISGGVIATLLVMEQTGHMVFSENAACLKKAIARVLTDPEKDQQQQISCTSL